VRCILTLTYRANHRYGWTLRRETYAWLERFSSGIRSAIDIGANEGVHTSFFLLKTSAKHVWSFDGDPACQGMIARNLALNGFRESDRWTFVPQCVGCDGDSNTCSLDSIANAVEQPCLVKLDR